MRILHLHCSSSNQEDKYFPLREGDVITIGRHSCCGLCLSGDRYASGTHCELYYHPNGTVEIEDRGSTNGTFVNGQKITRQFLILGDVVEIGRTRMRITDDSVENADQIVDQGTVATTLLHDPARTGVLYLKAGKDPVFREAIAPRKMELLLLHEVGKLVHHKSPIWQMLSSILETILTILDVERGCILFKTDDSRSLYRSRVQGSFAKDIFFLSSQVVKGAIKHATGTVSTDVLSDKGFSPSPGSITLSMRSIVCVPLQGYDVQGAIYLDSLACVRNFQESDLDLLTAIGRQVGLAMERAQAEESLQQTRQDLEKIVAQRTAELSQANVLLRQEIARRERAEQETREQQQQLIHIDKMAALGTLVSGIAHEINNPNSFITYNIPVLEESWRTFEPIVADYAFAHPECQKNGTGLDELCRDMREIIRDIKIGSERINKVVGSLKDFARVDDSACDRPVRVNEVIHNSLTIVGAQVKKSVGKMSVNLAGELPEIQGNSQKLEQVVINLVLNAVQAIPAKESGNLSITTRWLKSLNAVAIEVEDNGTGIEPGVMGHLFDPFFTTRRDSGGTGLGLSVSYSLVREHHGAIGVLSRPGLGSQFTLFLPADKGARLDLRPSILCVDDEEPVLEALREHFRVKEKIFTTMTEPEKVIEYLADHPEVDVVISDIAMPGMDGWRLLDEVRRTSPLIPVILYSGWAEALEGKADGPGPDYLLQKPFVMKEFFDIINRINRKRFWTEFAL